MSYADQQRNLTSTVSGLPPQFLTSLTDSNLVFLIEEIADPFGLTMGEIGELCEIVRKLIAKELPPENFETAVAEKLDEDNRPRASEIAFALNDQILTKLLPALGLKAPVIMKPVPPKLPEIEERAQTIQSTVSNIQTQNPESTLKPSAYGLEPVSPPARPVPLKKILPIPPSAPTLEPISTSPPRLAPSASNLAPISQSPIESLMKMTAGKVRERELMHRFDLLPETLKEALRSVDSARKVVDIARKHGLHVDKIGELGAQTGLVIFGFTHPGEFLSRLKGKLNLPEDAAREIAGEINSEIFLKIREALKEINGEIRPISPEVPPPSPSQPSKLTTDNLSSRGGSASGGKLKTAPPSPLPQKAPPPPAEKPSPSFPELTTSNLNLKTFPEPSQSRDEILREIENPARLKPLEPASYSPVPEAKIIKPETVLPLKQQMKTPSVPAVPNHPSFIPPTPPSPSFQPSKLTSLSTPKQSAEADATGHAYQLKPFPPPPNLPAEKPAAEHIDIVEQKLSAPTVAPKSEKRYSSDPYRESIE